MDAATAEVLAVDPGDGDADEVRARVRHRWNLEAPYPIPVPGWIKCPVCDSLSVFPREWRIGGRREPRGAGERRLSHRCDVSMKCAECSAVWPHGLAIDRADAERYGARGPGVHVVHWRAALPKIRAYARRRAQVRDVPGR